MDKILKFIKKLNKTERIKLLNLINLIIQKDVTKLKPKKLSGFDSLYRIRSGKIRIVFEKNKETQNQIINIDSRKNSYKKL
ncbi:type II toxin-antitoxin system RelE/ParE family toxin [Patescibacteria group bacterium]|nr:type II toxin-antitoxin system RelE/ParE family toxin [Patescibacteria group bacterium]